jgi:RNase H-like domain found in reverse transcriptase
MWIRRSDVLAPPTYLVSKKRKWEWKEDQQKAFETIKQIIIIETLFTYPYFYQPFHIHTDTSNTQLGGVISQNKRPIEFYSRQLIPAQNRYTTTEREFLAIVDTLKEFRIILLGHTIKVYTDHKNLTYTNFNTRRVMR